jgi:hypothetical protein
MDCGYRFHPYQMDFDHRDPLTKEFNLTAGHAMLMSRPRLLAEVAKCDIVCANCHDVRTQRQHQARLAKRQPGRSSRLAERREYWRAQARLLDDLRRVPCADCGNQFPPCAMEFDHRDPAQKQFRVTDRVGRLGTKRLLEEAAKCDIVCSNCHRMRTYLQRRAA